MTREARPASIGHRTAATATRRSHAPTCRIPGRPFVVTLTDHDGARRCGPSPWWILDQREDPMRYLMSVCKDVDDSYSPPTTADRDDAPEVEQWWQPANDAGTYVLGDRPRPAAEARTVGVRAGELRVTDGPFTEVSELVGGFDVLECDSIQQAVEIAAGHPMAHAGVIELRAVWPFEDEERAADASLHRRPTPTHQQHPSTKGPSMPLFAVLIYATDSAHSPGATAQTSEDIAACDAHAGALSSSAVMTAAWALTPRDLAKSIRATGTTDGPFIDADHVVAGFYILQAPNLDAALALARTNPVVDQGGGLEVRPIHSGGLVNDPSGLLHR